MFAPKRRHSSTDHRPRTAYLAALLLVISLLAAFNPGPAFAMPRDPIDPPPIGGDEEEPYPAPANGFEWSVPARFGLDVDPHDHMIDFHWRDSNDAAAPNTYEPAHIYPSAWPINLDGCRTSAEEEAGTSTDDVFVWHIHGQGALAAYNYQSPAGDPRCRFLKYLPEQGDYLVQLTVYDSAGNKIAPADDRLAYEQPVRIKDYLIVSIGDSFASGEGNPDIPSPAYPPSLVRWQDERCHRSAIAGPAQAAMALERSDPHTSVTFLSFACSGATVGRPAYDPVVLQWEPPFINLEPDEHMPRGTGILGRYRGQQVPNTLGYPDDNSQVETYEAYLPSQIDQLRTALTPPDARPPRTPDALIMSGGGNDIYFADIAQACVLTWDCFENSRMHESPHNGGYLIDTLVKRALGNSIDNPPITLKGSFRRLNDALNGLTVNDVNVKPRHIYITEYPDMGRDDNGNHCRMLDDIWWPNPLWVIENFETEEALHVLGALNSTIKYRADEFGWTYVDGMMSYVDDPTRPVPLVRDAEGKGHGYCATDNWIRTADEAEKLQGPLGLFRTKGTLHPAAQAHQVYKERILHYLLPDLAAELPAAPPAFQTSRTVGALTSFPGANSWFIRSCTKPDGTGSCEDKVVLKVTADADPNTTATLRGATSTVNGAEGCPAGAVCTGPLLSNGNKTATWTYALTADGIYHFSFTAQDSTGQTASGVYQLKADLHDPQLTAPAPLIVKEGGSVALQAQASDAGGGSADVDWDLDDDGEFETPDEQATFSAAALDGPVSKTVRVRAKDMAGRVVAATTTVSVLNVAPTAEVSVPSAAEEGSEIAFGSSVVDPGYNEGLTYAWQVTLGGVEVAADDVSNFTFTPADNGSYTVNLTVTDDDGDAGAATQTFDVANAAPTLSNLAIDTATLAEGGTVTLTGDIRDPGSADSFSLEIDWGDGSAAETIRLPAGATSLSAAHTYADDNPTGTASDLNTISVKLSDDDGASDTQSTTVTVNNRNPAITVTAPAESTLFPVTDPINVSATLSDAGADDTWSCEITWDDGTMGAGAIAGNACTSSKTYAAAGIYSIQVKVTDDDGGSEAQTAMIVVYDPSAGFVTGAGHIDSPAGAYTADPGLAGPGRFAFVSKYQKGAQTPSGQTQFEFRVADFKFEATAYDWLVVAGPKAQYKGTGTVNGSGSYSFLLTATDGQVNGGGDIDKFRIKIWDDAGIVYDNRLGVSDDMDGADPQAITTGSIVIHK